MQNKWDCLNSGGYWLNYYRNFDNIGSSMMSLFILSSTIGWSDAMYKGAATREIDEIPIQLANQYISFYFVAFVVVGNFFLLNLYVGVIISTYNREKEAMGKNFILT